MVGQYPPAAWMIKTHRANTVGIYAERNAAPLRKRIRSSCPPRVPCILR